jgi:hypothetical protein
MDPDRLRDPVIELRLPCGMATVRPEVNGRLWLGVEGSARPQLRLGDDGEPQFTLCGFPPTHGILAGLAPEGDVAIELADGDVIDAVGGGGAWLLAVSMVRLPTVIEAGTLVVRNGATPPAGRAVSSLRPFAVRSGPGEADVT